jgi:hypothetical protein
MSVDTFEFDYGKWLIRLSTEHDGTLGSPMKEYGDDGAYGPAQEKAWLNDEWQWVDLKVEAIMDGVTLGTAYLGGVESGWIPDDDGNEQKFKAITQHGNKEYTTGYYDPTQDLVSWEDTIQEAITEAQERLAKLAGKVDE